MIGSLLQPMGASEGLYRPIGYSDDRIRTAYIGYRHRVEANSGSIHAWFHPNLRMQHKAEASVRENV